jgi:hypothetical protein
MKLNPIMIPVKTEIEKLRPEGRSYGVEKSPIPNFREFLIDAFTQPIVDFKTHFCGAILIGFPGTGKSTFLQYIAEIIQNSYDINDTNILASNSFVQAADEMNDKSVQVIFTDDALALQDKRGLAGKLLAKIRHVAMAKRIALLYPEDFGFLGQMTIDDLIEYDIDQLQLTVEQERIGKRINVYVFFNTQEFYGIAVDIRRQCKILIFKSASNNPRDAPELRKLLGKKAFDKLRQLSKSTLKNKAFDEDLSKALIISFAHDEAGIVNFSDRFDRDRLRKVWSHVKIVNKLESEENNKNKAIFALERYTDSDVFARLPEIFFEELHNDSQLLSKAHKSISKTNLKRDITMWYLRQFCSWDYNDLRKKFQTGKDKNTPRIYVGRVRKFLVHHNAFKAKISERFFLEKLQNSTVSPPLFFQQKNRSFHLPTISHQHPDIYVAKESALVAVLAVKMHFERETFHPSPEAQYSQHYEVPAYSAIIDVQGDETHLRFQRLGEEASQQEELLVDTVEVRQNFDEIIAILEADLIEAAE